MINRIGSRKLFAPAGAGGGTAATMLAWMRIIQRGTNLTQEAKGVHAKLQAALKPAYTAAQEAFNALPLSTRLTLAEVTHNEGYFKPAVLPELSKDGIYVSPETLTQENAPALKALLTAEGQEQVDNMISGQHADKAFVTPAQILPGKVAEFLAFFGKNSPEVVARVEDLAAQGKKTKILNNLYMPWDVALAYVDRVYTDPAQNTAMKEMLLGLQFEAIADSAIIMAALDKGIIPESGKYVAMHEAWASHNHWGEWGYDPQAVVNFKDLPPDAQQKDITILDTHTAMRADLATVIQAINDLKA